MNKKILAFVADLPVYAKDEVTAQRNELLT